MGRFLFLVIAVMLSSCGNDKELEYFQNGNIKSERHINDAGQTDGILIEYYENGQVKSQGKWKNGLLNGVMLHYYPGGQLKEETSWIENKPQGISKRYYEDGKLWSTANYVNGKIRYNELYYPDGKILERQIYNADEDMIYFAKMDSTGFKYLEAALPLIKAEKDTITLGEPYRVHISFGLEMKGELNVYTGNLTADKELLDSVRVTKLDDYTFSYTYQPKKLGQGMIPFVFEHLTNENDSLRINNFRHRKTYYVKPSNNPSI